MSKHTPGPWVIDHETRPTEVCTIHNTTHRNGWVYVRGEIGYWSADEDENMANARLIAAAPDLLEALKIIMDNNCPLTGNPSRAELVKHWEYEKSQGHGEADDHLFALAAIAKATGGSDD